MGKVKVNSRNNQVYVQIRSTAGEQINVNAATELSRIMVDGFLPFSITTDNGGFTTEYRASGLVTAKEFFKNTVIDQYTFWAFMDSSVRALTGMSAYNMEYGNVLIDVDTVAVDPSTGRAFYMYYPVYGYNNGMFFNVFLSEILKMMKTPKDADLSYLGNLNTILMHPESMSWDILKNYVESIRTQFTAPQMMGWSQVPPVQPVMPQIVNSQPVMSQAVAMQPVQGNNVQPGRICPVCGTNNMISDALFCVGCGNRLQAQESVGNNIADNPEENKCPACGYLNKADAVFCSRCGGKLEEMKSSDTELPAEGGINGKDVKDESISVTDSGDDTADMQEKEDNLILIRNGRVVDAVTGTDAVMDVLIKNNMIEEVGKEIEADGAEIIDANGLVVAPGLVDTHVHFRDPGFTYKEDIITGAAAAARGGFTTVVCMANTNPAVDNVQTLDYIQKKGEQTGIHVLQAATVTRGLKGQELVDMDSLAQAGAAGFTDDGIPVMNEDILVKAMQKAAELDLPISLHEEDPEFIARPGVNMGSVSEQLGYGGASRTAEDVMVARDCMIALHTGASVCIQHISSGNSVELVRTAKKLGADVHAEATPHHFTLTEDAVLQYGTNARMNPPLRTEEDRRKIIEGIIDGTIDMIVTDHAPHSEEEKAKTLDAAPSGITGLETSLGLGIRSLVKAGHISLLKLMELMSKNPAEFYHMVPGSIQKGAPADIVIFGEDDVWTVKKEEFASKASNSPFIGWELPGKVHYTICNGVVVYKA